MIKFCRHIILYFLALCGIFLWAQPVSQLIEGENEAFHIEPQEVFVLKNLNSISKEDLRLADTISYEALQVNDFSSFTFEGASIIQKGHIDARSAGVYMPNTFSSNYLSSCVSNTYRQCIRVLDAVYDFYILDQRLDGYDEYSAESATLKLLYSPNILANETVNLAYLLFSSNYLEIRSNITKTLDFSTNVSGYSDLLASFEPGFFFNNYKDFSSSIPLQREEELRVKYYSDNKKPSSDDPVFEKNIQDFFKILDKNMDLAEPAYRELTIVLNDENLNHVTDVIANGVVKEQSFFLAEDPALNLQSRTGVLEIPSFYYYDLPHVTVGIQNTLSDVSVVFSENNSTQIYLPTKDLSQIDISFQASDNHEFSYQNPASVVFFYDIPEVFKFIPSGKTNSVNVSDSTVAIAVLDSDTDFSFLLKSSSDPEHVATAGLREFSEDISVTFQVALQNHQPDLNEWVESAEYSPVALNEEVEDLTVRLTFDWVNFDNREFIVRYMDVNDLPVTNRFSATENRFLDVVLQSSKPTKDIEIFPIDNDILDLEDFDFHVLGALVTESDNFVLQSKQQTTRTPENFYTILNSTTDEMSVTFVDSYVLEGKSTQINYKNDLLKEDTPYSFQAIFTSSDNVTSNLSAEYTLSDGSTVTSDLASHKATWLFPKSQEGIVQSVVAVFEDMASRGGGILTLLVRPDIETAATKEFSVPFLNVVDNFSIQLNNRVADFNAQITVPITLQESVEASMILDVEISRVSNTHSSDGFVFFDNLQTTIKQYPVYPGANEVLINLISEDDNRQFGDEAYLLKAKLVYDPVTNVWNDVLIQNTTNYVEKTVNVVTFDATRTFIAKLYKSDGSEVLSPVDVMEGEIISLSLQLDAQPLFTSNFHLVGQTETINPSYDFELLSNSVFQSFSFGVVEDWEKPAVVAVEFSENISVTFDANFVFKFNADNPAYNYNDYEVVFNYEDNDVPKASVTLSDPITENTTRTVSVVFSKSLTSPASITLNISYPLEKLAEREFTVRDQNNNNINFVQTEINGVQTMVSDDMLFSFSANQGLQPIDFSLFLGANNFFEDDLSVLFEVEYAFYNTVTAQADTKIFSFSKNVVNINPENISFTLTPDLVTLDEGTSDVNAAFVLNSYPYAQNNVSITFKSSPSALLIDTQPEKVFLFERSNWDTVRNITFNRSVDSLFQLNQAQESVDLVSRIALDEPSIVFNINYIQSASTVINFKDSYTVGESFVSVTFQYDVYEDATFVLTYTSPYPSSVENATPLFLFKANNERTIQLTSTTFKADSIIDISLPSGYWGETTVVLTLSENDAHYQPSLHSTMIKNNEVVATIRDVDVVISENQTYQNFLDLSATPLYAVSGTIDIVNSANYSASVVWDASGTNEHLFPLGARVYPFTIQMGDDSNFNYDDQLSITFSLEMEDGSIATTSVVYNLVDNDSLLADVSFSSPNIVKNFNSNFIWTSNNPESVSLLIKVISPFVKDVVLKPIFSKDSLTFSPTEIIIKNSDLNLTREIAIILDDKEQLPYTASITFEVSGVDDIAGFLQQQNDYVEFDVDAFLPTLDSTKPSLTINLYEEEGEFSSFDIPITLESGLLTVVFSENLIRNVETFVMDEFIQESETTNVSKTFVYRSTYIQGTKTVYVPIASIQNKFLEFQPFSGQILFLNGAHTYTLNVQYHDDDTGALNVIDNPEKTLVKTVKEPISISFALQAKPEKNEPVKVLVGGSDLQYVTVEPKTLEFDENNWNVEQTFLVYPVVDSSLSSDSSIVLDLSIDKTQLSVGNAWSVDNNVASYVATIIYKEFLDFEINLSSQTITEGQSITINIENTNLDKVVLPTAVSISVDIKNFDYTLSPIEFEITSSNIVVSSVLEVKRNLEQKGNENISISVRNLKNNVTKVSEVEILEYNIERVSSCGFLDQEKAIIDPELVNGEATYNEFCAKELQLSFVPELKEHLSPTFNLPDPIGNNPKFLYYGYTTGSTEARYATFFDLNNDSKPDVAYSSDGVLYEAGIEFKEVGNLIKTEVSNSNAIGLEFYGAQSQIIYTNIPLFKVYFQSTTPKTFSLYDANTENAPKLLLTDTDTSDAVCDTNGCTRTINPVDFLEAGTSLEFGVNHPLFIGGSLGQVFNVQPTSPITIKDVQYNKTYVKRGDIIRGRMSLEVVQDAYSVGVDMASLGALKLLGDVKMYTENSKNNPSIIKPIGNEKLSKIEIGNFLLDINDAKNNNIFIEFWMVVDTSSSTKNNVQNKITLTFANMQSNAIFTKKFQLLADPIFDNSLLFGKVFGDTNNNDKQDEGELGVANVEILDESGYIVLTDAYGRYSIPNLTKGAHYIKMNARTLPKGYEAKKHAQLVRVNSVPEKVNFALKVLEQDGNENKKPPTILYENNMYLVEKGSLQKPWAEFVIRNYQPRLYIIDLVEPIAFHFRSNYLHYIKKWTIDILNADLEVIHQLFGTNKELGDVIKWSGKSEEGYTVLKNKVMYYYRFSIEDTQNSVITTKIIPFIAEEEDIYKSLNLDTEEEEEVIKAPKNEKTIQLESAFKTQIEPNLNSINITMKDNHRLKKVSIGELIIHIENLWFNEKPKEKINILFPKASKEVKILAK